MNDCIYHVFLAGQSPTRKFPNGNGALLNPGNGAQFPGALASRRRVPVFGSRLAGATGGRSQAVHREFENKFAFAKKSGY
jgi:hypothetical protein